jgi:hypothetical protein
MHLLTIVEKKIKTMVLLQSKFICKMINIFMLVTTSVETYDL